MQTSKLAVYIYRLTTLINRIFTASSVTHFAAKCKKKNNSLFNHQTAFLNLHVRFAPNIIYFSWKVIVIETNSFKYHTILKV